MPEAAFEALAEHLGPTIECFASPLNARYGCFFSAFPALERRFGSLGSFFGPGFLDVREGTFEANPPFVPEVMDAMVERIELLLSDETKGPLSSHTHTDTIHPASSLAWFLHNERKTSPE